MSTPDKELEAAIALLRGHAEKAKAYAAVPYVKAVNLVTSVATQKQTEVERLEGLLRWAMGEVFDCANTIANHYHAANHVGNGLYSIAYKIKAEIRAPSSSSGVTSGDQGEAK